MKSKQAAEHEDFEENVQANSTSETAESKATSAESGGSDATSDEAIDAEIIADDEVAETTEKAGAQATSEEKGESGGPLEHQISDLTQQLLRTRADFDNFRRRTRQEKQDLQQFATKKLLEELLPVVDNFERALSSFSADSSVSEELKSGIEMVHRQLVGVLEHQGVQCIDAVGEPFDPTVHEAVMQETVDGQEAGVVLAELQKGYTIHGKVLRPAMVKVTS